MTTSSCAVHNDCQYCTDATAVTITVTTAVTITAPIMCRQSPLSRWTMALPNIIIRSNKIAMCPIFYTLHNP